MEKFARSLFESPPIYNISFSSSDIAHSNCVEIILIMPPNIVMPKPKYTIGTPGSYFISIPLLAIISKR